MEELGTDSRHEAYQALRGTLHALRDRLTVEEVAQLGAQLPMLVSGIYYEHWDPTGKPIKMRHKDEFLERVSETFGRTSDLDAEKGARAVFRVLGLRISEGEMQDIAAILPDELRELWPEGRRR
jgi:uncharacterized protein (DUF2267 family)